MLRIGEREFEHLFCQIDSDSRSMHGGLLSCGQLNASHPVWHFDAVIPAGGVHSISKRLPVNVGKVMPWHGGAVLLLVFCIHRRTFVRAASFNRLSDCNSVIGLVGHVLLARTAV